MFQENRMFPKMQRKQHGKSNAVSQPFPKGSVLPFAAVIVIAVVIVAVILVAVFWNTPQRTAVDLSMNAVRLSAKGEPSTEGRVVLQGYRLDYRSDAEPSVFEAKNVTIMDTGITADDLNLYYDGDALSGSAHCKTTDYTVRILPDPNGSWCVIILSGEYIVCSTQDTFDPKNILTQCASVFPDIS